MAESSDHLPPRELELALELRPRPDGDGAPKLCDSSASLADEGDETVRCARLAEEVGAEIRRRRAALAEQDRGQEDRGLRQSLVAVGCFLLAVLPVYAAARLALLARSCGDASRRLCRLLLGLSLKACFGGPYLAGAEAFGAGAGRSGRPVVLLANHCSKLDAFVLGAAIPLRIHQNFVIPVGNEVFATPLLRTIAAANGWPWVRFARHPDGTYKPEATAGERVVAGVERHLRNGGHAGWFPEGTTAGADDKVVGLFRARGMQPATRVDVEIWLMAVADARRGRPRLAVRRLCESSLDFCAAGGDNSARAARAEPEVFLADEARRAVQSMLDELYSSGVSTPPHE